MIQWKELKKLAKLALPVLIVNLTNVGMNCVDTIVAGQAGEVSLSAVAIGSSIYTPVALFAAGILMIIGPVISNMMGMNVKTRIGYFLNHGLWLAFALSVFVMPILWFVRPIIGMLSDNVDMVHMSEDYILAIMWGVPAFLGFVTLKSLNEGVNMTKPAMYVGIIGLLVNIPANFIFVFGLLGMPKMGAAGCGVATALIFWIEFLLIFIFVYRHPKHRSYRKHIVMWRRPTLSVVVKLIKLGIPVGISILCEVLLFCVASLVLAPLGVLQVASHQVAVNVSSLVFMLPLSVGLASSIRVAYHLGKKDRVGVKSAIILSYALVLVIAVITCIGIVLFRYDIALLYNDNPEIISLAGTLLLIGVFYQLSDCVQVVSTGVLRGFRDTVSISVITFISYWIVGFPICYVLARTNWIVPQMDAKGVWIGFICGLTVSAILLIIRVRKVYRRDLIDAGL